jgi:hypothetical protein
MNQTSNIKAFFNPRHDGDTFAGLGAGMGIDGEVADHVIGNLPEFLKAAGRDYFIKKVPAGVFDPTGAVDDTGNIVPAWMEVENQYHLVRSSDHRVVSPHTVSDQYAPLSLFGNIVPELQPWCDAGWASPDGVYSGRNESLEILTLRLDAAGNLPDDGNIVPYVVFENPHGAGGTAKGKIIFFRIVCQNTFAAAVSTSADFSISHRVARGDHDKQQEIMAERAQEAISAWEKVQEHISKISEKITVWSDSKLQTVDAEQLTDVLLGINPAKELKGRKKNVREAILAAYDMPQFGTNGQTGFDWINAVTFVNSSPNSSLVQGSKVAAVDRAIRNMNVNGTGFKLEQRAEKVLANFIS